MKNDPDAACLIAVDAVADTLDPAQQGSTQCSAGDRPAAPLSGARSDVAGPPEPSQRRAPGLREALRNDTESYRALKSVLKYGRRRNH